MVAFRTTSSDAATAIFGVGCEGSFWLTRKAGQMGIKYDETTKRYEVSYYKRHPKTGVPCRACRIGIKTEAEAKRVYSKLILQVEQKLHNTGVPIWEKFV